MAHSDWTRIFQNKARILKEEDSWSLEFDESLAPKYPNKGWKMTVRSTCARFRCSKCGRVWASNKAGPVKAKPLHQKCKTCDDGQMEEPSISSGNIAVLMDNLVEQIRKKCYNEFVGRKSRHFRSFDAQSPHEPAHCEACMQGICPRS
uniref:Receptor-transporting protein 3-like n=1 Tax=Labrus bergylta TaxID=56723 RepID=A0A3Q3E0W8_9LABR